MKNLKPMLMAAAVCTLAASVSLEARPIYQIEADIKAVKANMQTCNQNLDELAKLIADTAADPYSNVTIGQLQTWRDAHAANVKCFQALNTKLGWLKEELAKSPPAPSVKGSGTESHRHLLQEIARLQAEAAAKQARLRELLAKLKVLEARANKRK